MGLLRPVGLGLYVLRSLLCATERAKASRGGVGPPARPLAQACWSLQALPHAIADLRSLPLLQARLSAPPALIFGQCIPDASMTILLGKHRAAQEQAAALGATCADWKAGSRSGLSLAPILPVCSPNLYTQA